LIEDDAVGFGQQMGDGHASLRELYEVGLPELDVLVEMASKINGCYGAWLTGAGFGGCTINLMESSRVEEFTRQLIESYRKRYGLPMKAYACKPSRGVYIERIGK
jgi:galactokinase